MAAQDIQTTLNAIVKKSQNPSQHSISSDELKALASAFLPDQPNSSTNRPKAFVVLSAICQGARSSQSTGKDTGTSTQLLIKMFAPVCVHFFGETDDTSLLIGASFLTALFQVDSGVASPIFTRDGLIENVTDSVELSPSLTLSVEVAHLLAQASGHKACRAIITPQTARWLEFKSRQTTDLPLQAAAALALIKLAKGIDSDKLDSVSTEVEVQETDGLADILTEIVATGQEDAMVEAVEGLAYSSIKPILKERLVGNATFLERLFSLVPSKKTGTKPTYPSVIYGVMAIIYNLTSFRPRLSEEQEQVERLKKMARNSTQETSALDDDNHVKARIRLLISAGVLPVFSAAISATSSAGVKQHAGRSLLCIVEEKENRGKVLQAGCGRLLQIIIKHALAVHTSGPNDAIPNLAVTDLESIQALAKLSITASPFQVFGADTGLIQDALRPFSILLQHPSSNLLQKFEAVMALTNLASHSPEIATRIATLGGLIDKVELYLLEDHTLMRRATMELLCNLIVGSDDMLQRYSGDSPSSASKIHIFLALCDVEDPPTRLASSGALAILSSTPSVDKALVDLQFEKHRLLPIMTQLLHPSSLVDPDEEVPETTPGLVHRAVVCVTNVMTSVEGKPERDKLWKEAKDCGLVQALIHVAKGEGVVKDPSILHQASEALKRYYNYNNSA